jgi:hypothetical protein
MKPQKKGKPAKKSNWNWTKTLMVVGGVAFVFVMIFTSLGMGWLTSMKPAVTGDVGTIDYTIRDSQNRPVLTSNMRLYNATIEKGGIIMLTSALNIPIDSTNENKIIIIPAYIQGYSANSGLLVYEYDTLSKDLLGMKSGELKTISFPQLDGVEMQMTAEEFNQLFNQTGYNFNTFKQNDQILLPMVDQPNINLDDSETPDTYFLRVGYIKEKTNDTLTIDYAYSTAEINLIRLNNR